MNEALLHDRQPHMERERSSFQTWFLDKRARAQNIHHHRWLTLHGWVLYHRIPPLLGDKWQKYDERRKALEHYHHHHEQSPSCARRRRNMIKICHYEIWNSLHLNATQSLMVGIKGKRECHCRLIMLILFVRPGTGINCPLYGGGGGGLGSHVRTMKGGGFSLTHFDGRSVSKRRTALYGNSWGLKILSRRRQKHNSLSNNNVWPYWRSDKHIYMHQDWHCLHLLGYKQLYGNKSSEVKVADQQV